MTETTELPKDIVTIISRISDEAGALAPTQDPASGLKFAFRGINAVVDHLAPLLDKYGVIVTPTLISHKVEMHPVKDRFLTDAWVEVAYDFTAPDGSVVTATTLGYAQDYADRAASQAQSVSFRVALLQSFHLPTSDPEPEALGAETERITLEQSKKPDAKPVAGAAPVPNAAVDSVDAIRADIAGLIAGTYTDLASGQVLDAYPGGGAAVNKLANELTKKKPDDWGKSAVDLKKVREKLIADLKG